MKGKMIFSNNRMFNIDDVSEESHAKAMRISCFYPIDCVDFLLPDVVAEP